MNREEEIKQAASAYTLSMCNECSAKSYCDGRNKKCVEYREQAKVFADGAKWADEHSKNVWHDASEEPEEETWVLATNEKDIIDVYHLRKGRKYNFDGNLIDWSKFVVNFNLTKWAYIKDLLPKGGEV